MNEEQQTNQTTIPTKKKRRPLRFIYFTGIHLLAAMALFFIVTALAVKFKWTNDAGGVDTNSRYFAGMADKYNQGFKTDSIAIAKNERLMFQSIGVLAKYYPHNAKIILTAYERSKDPVVGLRMLDAVNLKLLSNKAYQREIKALAIQTSTATVSLYPWANYREWKEFCVAVSKDKKAIDSVAKITGVEARLIVTCLVGEQIRMFNSSREQFKQYVIPFNKLILTNNRGYGVTGINKSTALKIERNLFDKKSQFYAGNYFENLLNINDSFPEVVVDSIESHQLLTIQRLIRGGDHYYSYLYTAFFIRQFQAQWERFGYTLAYRPEIIGTLYNLGYEKSKPKKNPLVGGSTFNVGDKEYTFGGLCFEFYYSGELQDLFPLTSEPFTPVNVLQQKYKFSAPPPVTNQPVQDVVNH